MGVPLWVSIGALLGACLGVVPRSVAKGQGVPVPFVHGFRGGSGTWASTAGILQSQLRLAPILPGLPWSQSFATQANSLNAVLSGLSDVPAVGHSNGGLAIRELVRLFPGRVDRVATVGTPHLGAPIADNIAAGNLDLFLSTLLGDMFSAVNFFAGNDPYFQTLIQTGPISLAVILNYGVAVAQRIAPAVSSMVAGPLDGPVYTDLRANSAFLSTINGAPNQALEAALTRVSIVTQTTPNGALAKFMSPTPDVVTSIQYGMMFVGVVLSDYYRYHPDIYLRQFAYYWDRVFWDWYFLDPSWHYLIGALGGIFGSSWIAKPSDGLIPWEKSAWGEPRSLLLSTGAEVLHRSQPSHPRVVAELRQVLETKFGLVPRSQPPPPPPPPPPTCPPPMIVC